MQYEDRLIFPSPIGTGILDLVWDFYKIAAIEALLEAQNNYSNPK
ncbi:hypothetical protein QT972_34580 [Microcoleus sp. herbarium7]